MRARMIPLGAMGSLGVLLSVLPAAGHHSFAAEFDSSKPVTIQGTITKVEWRNPHIWVYINVVEADGRVTPWQCEGGAPNALTRQGWTRDSLTLGGPLTVAGYKAKDGTNTCNATTWTVAGKRVLAGSAAGPAAVTTGTPGTPR